MSRRPGTVFASAMFVAAFIVAAGDATWAGEGSGGVAPSGAFEGSSAHEATALARRVALQERMARARAHARMPDTMYASTPSDEVPPHPGLSDAGVSPTAARAPGPVSMASGMRLHHVPLFASAADALGRQGFVRVVNRSDEAGGVRIDAYDDAGTQHGPVTLALGAGRTVHFNSADLEEGNADKGLSGATGAPGEGDWRLVLGSALALEVLSYMRTSDGFLTSLHDLAPSGEAGHRVAIFNPGSNANQVSRLRLVNPGEEPAAVRIEGIDDAGASPGTAVEVTVAGGASRTLTSQALESGAGLVGALGDGAGKWRLAVTSDQPVLVMSLLSSPTGHLTNLSSEPARPADGGGHAVPLVPAAGRYASEGLQGFVRVVNRSDEGGEVRIDAYDDAGTQHGPVTLTLGAGRTVHFNSADLEEGNSDKGLSGATGAPGEGDWRLVLESALELEVLSYMRTSDGFLTSLHDLAPSGEAGHRVVIFNPGSNANQVSRLRLVNPGAEPAAVRIEGIDDAGASPGTAVEVTVAGGASRTLSSQALESGAGLVGALGDGAGKWRLAVTSDEPVLVMSLLSSPTGHLTNLSSEPRGTVEAAPSAAAVFAEHVSAPVVQAKCVNCHVAGGIAGATRLHFVPASSSGHEAHNLAVFEAFVAAVDGAAELILNKVQGVGHGGGVQVPAGSVDFANLERFLGLLGEPVSSAPLTPQTLFDTVTMAPGRTVLRRAALIFAGRTPTDAEYAALRTRGALRPTIRGLMTGPEFHEFLIRGANDRLLTDRVDGDVIARHARHFVEYTNEAFRRLKAAHESGNEREYFDWKDKVQHGARRAPLELIAHVVENDLPYTEVLTADYIMANPWAAAAYGASTRFDDPGDENAFKPTQIVRYHRLGEGFEDEEHPFLGPRVVDPGPLSTDWPHAGVLNTIAFLRRYPTTATNRNRARSRWTYYHFLGLDIEKSASRTTDPVALADTNNPTMHNPACTVCHRIMDPVVGAFQNYGDEGYYKDKWGGMDSLDELYKEEQGTEVEVRADSRENRKALSWPLLLTAGDHALTMAFTNDLGGPSGHVHLDLLRVTNARSRVVVSRELETTEPPFSPWGPCGAKRNDHFELWDSSLFCRLYIDIKVPSDGVYTVEVVAWGDRGKRYGQDGKDRFAKLAVTANAYQHGDTWYRDMRAPGFADKLAPNPDNSVQWLAKQIVTDERFAEATVKFWWPAIMGSEVAEPPADEDDADFEGLLLAANAQNAEVTRLARGLRRGFQGRAAYDLKDLLAEIVLSKWFRADADAEEHPVRRVALRDAGARRLLTPEELDRKTAALTGLRWGWAPRISDAYRGPYSRLTGEYRLLYGGIDSDGITERASDITSVMAGVAKRHAVQVSCPVVMRELYLVSEANRRLFAGIDQQVTPNSELGELFEIRANSRNFPETLVLTGRLRAGPKTVRLAFTNDYWDESTRLSRDVHLDRLDVRDSAGDVAASFELEELSEGNCKSPNGDNFALWCEASAEVQIEVPATGRYSIEVVAWAEQAGDELPRLSVVVEGAEGAGAVRRKLVELHDKLFGVRVTPNSPDVESAYRLFVEVMELGRASDDHWLEWWHCDGGFPLNYFEGLLTDVVVEREDEIGWKWYEFDWDHVNEFMTATNWSDPHHAAQAWIVVLSYLLMDYRYLYL